jgi:hypothetical protein
MWNKKKDNVFTINLPEDDLIFTRYLYLKDEVDDLNQVCVMEYYIVSDDMSLIGFLLYGKLS